jgi:gluconolactonase
MRIPRLLTYGCICLMLSTVATAADLLDFQIKTYDERFSDYIDAESRFEILASELGWAEGPVWVASLDSLLFSDVAKDRVYRWNEKDGLAEYLSPSGHKPDDAPTDWRGSNGLAIDKHGSLLLAQQGNRVLARMRSGLDHPVADYEVLASHYHEQPINSPNDLVSHPSGDIYFTDPPYGLAGFENSPDIKLDFFGVFRRSKDGQLMAINKTLEKPNGIALSIDHRTLYVSNSEPGREKIIAIDLEAADAASNSRLLFDAAELYAADPGNKGPGSTDGMTVHASGTLFVSLPGGFGLLTLEGKLLGKVLLGQITNMAFDTSFSYLYLTAPDRLLRIKMKASTAASPTD